MITKTCKLIRLTCTIVLIVTGLGCSPQPPAEIQKIFTLLPDKIDYNFDVKPILSDRCYKCHGPDENARKGNLRLDIESRAFAELENGKHAFVKGKLGKSEAFRRITSNDPEYQMPPPDSKLSLSNRDIAIIIKWLEQGAEWQPHWSLVPVTKPAVPPSRDAWQAYNPIDHFIQTKMMEVDLAPNPPAKKERLLRRVTMDLTGLPPTIEEIEDFLADHSADAYAKVVDRLLESEAHAERMAMEWLDVARYADSHGPDFDGYRYVWPYRDWVINAFYENLPYDQFITWQVAGDLLDNPHRNQLIATSFYRQNPQETAGGSIDEEFRLAYVAERTATTGTAFLGLTIGCARCHDHKFDPVSQKEFYQLSAFFNTTEEMGLGPIDAVRAPTLLLYEDHEKAKIDSLDQSIQVKEVMLDQKKGEIQKIKNYIKGFDSRQKIKGEIVYVPFDKAQKIRRIVKKSKMDTSKTVEYEHVLILDQNKTSEATLGVTLVEGKQGKGVLFDGEYDYVSLIDIGTFEHFEPFSVSTWIKTNRQDKGPTQTIMGNSNQFQSFYRGWDFALDSTNHLQVRLIHRLPDELIEVVTKKRIDPKQWTQVSFTYDGSRRASGISIFINGQKQTCIINNDRLQRTIKPIDWYTGKLEPLPLWVGRSYRLFTFDVGLFDGQIDELRIYNRDISPWEMALLGESEEAVDSESLVLEHMVNQDPGVRAIEEELKKLRMARTAVIDSIPEVMIMEEMAEPRKTHLLDRGVYDQPLEVVEPGTPTSILPFPTEFPKNRLGLSKWLTHPKNPLTARVTINRYWSIIFGKGIVKTPEDFGSQGDLPTHPHLLTWLAAEFIESNWDLRKMLKLMVMSYTYRQSSIADTDKYEIDPTNQYYSRSESYRWPAEFIRDNALSASGLLHRKLGGPSVKPYQPEGLWEELAGTSYSLLKYEPDSGVNLYRRSLYTFVRRFAPHPFMINFDATAREFCVIHRANTSTPLQALTLLNDPQIIEASRLLSERMQKETSDRLKDQITHGYRLSTGISPSVEHLQSLTDQYHASYQRFEADPQLADSLLSVGEWHRDPRLDKTKTAALAMVANTIFNIDESYMKR